MTYEPEGMALGAFLGAYFGMVCLFIIVITVLSIIANWKVYTKAGREGWKCLIPVYNVYVLYDMVWETKQFWIYLGLMIGSAVFSALGSNLFVALVSLALSIAILVWSIRLLHHLSVCFGHGPAFTVGLVLLNTVFVMILAFGDSKYCRQTEKVLGDSVKEEPEKDTEA